VANEVIEIAIEDGTRDPRCQTDDFIVLDRLDAGVIHGVGGSIPFKAGRWFRAQLQSGGFRRRRSLPVTL
jgi:hypothetical protein